MIKKIISQSKEKSFLIAYSGGLDSTVLLHQMFKIKLEIPQIKIRAIHINHHISTQSNHWATHCQKTCKKYSIPLIIDNIYTDPKKNNTEEQLRIKRYQIIYKHIFCHEIIMTGHHANDQCETFILSLKRGSGPTGLSGISEISYINNHIIARPFLKKTRKELRSLAISYQLEWIEDNSNTDLTYDRNFIRHKIIPLVEKRWPSFLKNCVRTSNICRIETRLLRDFLKKEIKKYILSDNTLDATLFKKTNQEKCKAIIRYWLSLQITKMPSYDNIQHIYQQMVNSRIDANPKIILQKKEIRRYKNKIFLIQTYPIVRNTILFWHDINKNLILPHQLGELVQNITGSAFPTPKINELINIRFQCEGKFLIIGKTQKRKIKKIWQEKNIPPWLRHQIPLLFYNNCFIGALGVFTINNNIPENDTWKISWQNSITKKNNNNVFIFS